MTRDALDVYSVPTGHSDQGETTEDEDLPARGPGQRSSQPTDPRAARARRRLEAIALSAAALAFGLLEMAHGSTHAGRPDAPATPAKPGTVVDERALSVAAYQRDWVMLRAGERGVNVNQRPYRSVAVVPYQADWISHRAGERASSPHPNDAKPVGIGS